MSPLYMLRIEMDQRELLRIGSRKALRGQPLDLGYLVHSALGETFGVASPSPFVVEGTEGARVRILAYGFSEEQEYREAMHRSNSAFILPKSFELKKMPETFSTESIFNYRIRVCPVIRKARGAGRNAGKERDVFLDAVEKAGGNRRLNRQSVYGEWFSMLLARAAGVRVLASRATSLSRTDVMRRGSDRAAKKINRPEAVFEGRLQVEDGERLSLALQRGIGRHRAFGFGMLLLRRAR